LERILISRRFPFPSSLKARGQGHVGFFIIRGKAPTHLLAFFLEAPMCSPDASHSLAVLSTPPQTIISHRAFIAKTPEARKRFVSLSARTSQSTYQECKVASCDCAESLKSFSGYGAKAKNQPN
jgi:hypothetical protein